MKPHTPQPQSSRREAPEKGPFLLRHGRLPGWAVKELQAYYQANGMGRSEYLAPSRGGVHR